VFKILVCARCQKRDALRDSGAEPMSSVQRRGMEWEVEIVGLRSDDVVVGTST
jgi:hypothetical protein